VITIRVEDCGNEVRVSIEDTGPGIPDELKGLIFNRFKRGSSRASGSGLGLYICRMLIERYGGRIWVDDRMAGQPEEGTAFRFTLRRQQTTGEV
jgi:two-component system sensor histidine kinase BarA